MYKDLICHKRKDNAGKLEKVSPAEEHVGKFDKKKDDNLETVFRQLDEIKTILNTLFEQRYEDKAKIERNMRTNVEELVLPYLERLKNCNLKNDQKLLVNCLESSLKNITSLFFENLGLKLSKLTPMEIKVADLVRRGKTNKEIADLLCLSINTILSHRYKLREKLGLKNKKINLGPIFYPLRNSEYKPLLFHYFYILQFLNLLASKLYQIISNPPALFYSLFFI